MGWSTERGGVYHPTLADQQQQQQQPQPQQQPQQQWSPSPRAMLALELYRACVAAGQKVRFMVEQRPEGEYFTLSSRPPPPASPATQAAAAGVRRPRRKPNKRRAEKQQIRRESRRSTTAARSQQQPLGNGTASDPQQQQQQQARASSSCTRNTSSQLPLTVHSSNRDNSRGHVQQLQGVRSSSGQQNLLLQPHHLWRQDPQRSGESLSLLEEPQLRIQLHLSIHPLPQHPSAVLSRRLMVRRRLR